MQEKEVYSAPFFSICIPVYNAEQFLCECIDSVLSQSEKDFEIVLVNDGSLDLSGKICDEYKDRYNRVTVCHKNNEGPLLARHDAVRISKGKYLVFLDSDDMLEPDALEKIKKTIQVSHADMVLFDWRSFSQRGIAAVQTEPFEDGVCFADDTKQDLCAYFMSNSRLNSMCRKCISRNLYDTQADYSCFKGMRQGEDKLISIYCVDKAQKIIYIKAALYRYRVNTSGTTHNVTLKNYKDVQVLHRVVLRYIGIWGLPQKNVDERMRIQLGCGCNCIISIANRISRRKSTVQELREAVNYIASDEDFLEAYSISGKRLGAAKELVCSCIIKRRVGAVRLLALAVQIKNKVKDLILLRH